LDFDIVREEVIVKNVSYAGFYPEESNNAYIKLSNFSRSASDEVKRAIRDLRAKKEIHSMVLDLRGNPGGLLDIAVDICDKFLPKDILIVSTKGRAPASVKEYFSTQEPMLGTAKVVVLIDGGSASASEIVAGALQDHDRGVILGTKSFGKGLVQTITQLSYNSSLKITTAKYYTPSGRCIQKIDYSDHNDVIADSDSILSGEFFTDNQRLVFAKGGISPDTTVTFLLEGKITKELLAHGLFFKFANQYYYKNPDLEYSSIDDKKTLEEFRVFVQDSEFEYESDAEDNLSRLISDVSKNYTNLTEELTRLQSKISDLKKDDFEFHKDEILIEIKSEFAVRYLGSEGRIKEQLKTDLQFQSALNIIESSSVYDNLLNIN
jgi:carboxyl-terminal processing protease